MVGKCCQQRVVSGTTREVSFGVSRVEADRYCCMDERVMSRAEMESDGR